MDAKQTHKNGIGFDDGTEEDASASLAQTADRPRKPHDSISESLSRFDFSMDDKLAVKLSTSSGEFPQPRNALSASSSGNHRVVVERSTPDSIVNQLSDLQNTPQHPIPQNDDTLRGVDNISYDFNIRSLKKSSGTDDNDEAVTPWLYENKFRIDRVPPDPNSFLPCPQSIFKKYIAPLAPTILFLIIAIIASRFSGMAGIISLMLTVISTIVSFPNVKPVSRKTPLSTLKAYIQARDGLCFAQGYTLLAQRENRPSIDLHLEWPNIPRWKAIINRLNPVPLPDSHVVSGSEEENAVLVIAITKDAYFLVPMISVGQNWYITNPSLDRHPRDDMREEGEVSP